jgi:hypothetical protein
MTILNKEREFLGVHWEQLFALFKESPAIFNESAHEAYRRYRDHIAWEALQAESD